MAERELLAHLCPASIAVSMNGGKAGGPVTGGPWTCRGDDTGQTGSHTQDQVIDHAHLGTLLCTLPAHSTPRGTAPNQWAVSTI
jgi:hypothetical protein